MITTIIIIMLIVNFLWNVAQTFFINERIDNLENLTWQLWQLYGENNDEN